MIASCQDEATSTTDIQDTSEAVEALDLTETSGDASPGLPRSLPFVFERDLGVEEPVPPGDTRAFTLRLAAFLKETRYFDYLLRTSHGVAESTGKKPYALWWTEVDAVKEGDLVRFVHQDLTEHDGGGHNMLTANTRILGPAVAAALLSEDPGVERLVTRLCQGVSSMMLGMQYDALVERVGELEAKWMAARLRQVLIYPNLILFDGISTQLRSWRPVSCDETEVHAVCVAPVGESAAARDRRIRQYEDFYGASGIATPDDLTEFDACQSGYYGKLAQWHDFDRGMARRHLGADRFAEEVGIDPVVSASDFADETLYHGEYRHWLNTLIGGIKGDRTAKRAA